MKVDVDYDEVRKENEYAKGSETDEYSHVISPSSFSEFNIRNMKLLFFNVAIRESCDPCLLA
jgi:hypothetical protein